MAQVQPLSASVSYVKPSTPPNGTKPVNVPRLSPSRIPAPLVTSPSYRNGRFHLDTFSPVNQNGSFEFDRVIKNGQVLRRTKKKGAWKPSWKPTFLVLRPNLLSVYRNNDETELSASITLSEVTAVARVKKTNTENVFGIFTPAKNYHFSARSEREMFDWITLLRIEARTDVDEELDLPLPGLPSNAGDSLDSETTDLSAEEDVDRPGSPEMPQWTVRGSKSRSSTQTNSRKPSNLREYSGNEQYTTSQSDFSDAATAGLSSSVPKNKQLGVSSFAGQTGKLSPIPSDGPLPRPSYQRSASQLSVQGLGSSPAVQAPQIDPNRVIRQGYLQLLKTVSGVRQWKSLWAVLRPTGLSLYKSTSEYEPIKIVSIHSLIDAAEIDPVSKSKRLCLQVISEEKTWKFSVESETDLEGWLGALKSVLVKKGRGLSSAHGIPPPPATPTPATAIGGPVTSSKENLNPVQGLLTTPSAPSQPQNPGRIS